MEIKIITSQNEWNQALKGAIFGPFQQSWEWGEVLLAEGKQVERLAVMGGAAVVALAQVELVTQPFGRHYAFAAAGPVIVNTKLSPEAVCTVLGKYLKKKNYAFFRIEPLLITPYTLHLKKTIDLTPSTTTILDLDKSFDVLLAAMHKNTRYSIRQAESKGVVVKQEKNFEIFWNLTVATSERNGFKLHDKKHYEIILVNKKCVQLTAYHDGVAVATAVFWNNGDTFTYLFAASDYRFHELQAPYLLQKEAIALALQLGCKKYDFFGIAPAVPGPAGEYAYDKKHKYAGITKFKIGFGGEIVSRTGTFDVVLKPVQYALYNIVRKVRRLV